MMSETAFFVKDVVGPLGSASIVAAEAGSRGKSPMLTPTAKPKEFCFIEASVMTRDNWKPKMNISIWMMNPITMNSVAGNKFSFWMGSLKTDLTEHQNSAIRASEIVLAADDSFRSGEMIRMSD